MALRIPRVLLRLFLSFLYVLLVVLVVWALSWLAGFSLSASILRVLLAAGIGVTVLVEVLHGMGLAWDESTLKLATALIVLLTAVDGVRLRDSH